MLHHSIVWLGALALGSPQEGTPNSKPGSQTTQLPDVVVRTNEDVVVPPVKPNEPGSREVLQPKDIETKVVQSVNDLVQWVPGVSSRPYNGGDVVAPNFAIRGMPDDGLTEYILTTIDGVPANPMPYGWTAMSFFPVFPEQVQGVNLIKGGMSVRYSPNTVGGVLDFVTAPIPLERRFTFHASAGSNKTFSNLASLGETNGNFGWLLTAGDRRGDGYRDDGEYDQQVLDGKFRFTRSDGWTEFRASHFESLHQRPGGLSVAQFEENPFQNTRPDNYHKGWRNFVGVVDHSEGVNGDWSEVYAWYSQTYNRLDGPTPYSLSPTLLRRNTYTQYNVNAGWRAEEDVDLGGGEHRVNYGINAAYEWLPRRRFQDTPIGGGPTSETLRVEYDIGALSAHVDDTWKPDERWTINPGLRAEWVPFARGEDDASGGDFGEKFFDVLPALGVSYALDEESAVFANYQRSFRAPQVFGFDTSPAAPNGQNLEFEHGQQAELGVRAGVGGGVTASLVGWHSNFDDYAITVNGLYENLGNVVADGVDVGLAWDLARVSESLAGFEARVDGTFQDSQLEDAVNPANDGNQTPFAWKRKFTWTTAYRGESGWLAALSGQFIGESFSDDTNAVDENAAGTIGRNSSRTLWDAVVGRDFELRGGGNVRVSVGVHNLFDEEWHLHSRLGGKLLGQPRELLVSVSMSF